MRYGWMDRQTDGWTDQQLTTSDVQILNTFQGLKNSILRLI
jgi:hypothetical protein